jgi:hypothetical protein
MAISRMQQPRQMYGLGSFVKKAVKGVTKGIKSIAKSPIGKAAIIGGLGMYAGGLGPFASGSSMFGGKLAGLKGAGFLKNITGGGILDAAKNFLGGEKTLGKTLGVMAGGTLLGGLLSKAEEGDEEAIAATRDIGALRSYLDKGYRNLGYKEDEIPALVEEGVAEYTSQQSNFAAGGRVKLGNGSDDKSEMVKRVEELMDDGYDFGSAVKKYMEETRDKEANGGRIGYAGGTPRIRNVNTMSRNSLTKALNAMEIPETDSRDFDDNQIRELLIKFAPDLYTSGYANGGRIGYAFGNKPEQNAIQAAGIEGLPLNQNPAGVTELDLRDSGGFIPPVGVKEKADDIPAMLANNEFVFTADAVRGMGDGNVNKGAQRMYDMMKKLEKGGRV